MIAHQHPCVHPPTCPLTRLSQGLVKQKPIGFIAENALSSIPPCHHVVKRPAILDPNRSCHRSLLKFVSGICHDLLTDPYSTLQLQRLLFVDRYSSIDREQVYLTVFSRGLPFAFDRKPTVRQINAILN
jgi:hypothetical protein